MIGKRNSWPYLACKRHTYLSPKVHFSIKTQFSTLGHRSQDIGRVVLMSQSEATGNLGTTPQNLSSYMQAHGLQHAILYYNVICSRKWEVWCNKHLIPKLMLSSLYIYSLQKFRLLICIIKLPLCQCEKVVSCFLDKWTLFLDFYWKVNEHKNSVNIKT